ncbi:MAG: tRNA 2-thiouridine(34) synthase MnmA [Deinococcus sp.]|nr:tRNA 2-thiouridine(34) synthase MnmA [Deinococcus sp.]
MSRRVLVAMSGGVDSSVAAALLQRDGYDVVGVMMRLWPHSAMHTASGCCSPDAAYVARRVAEQLDIPFYLLDFHQLFEQAVIQPFLAAYAQGKTPNPCVRCNGEVKFKALLARALAMDADLATGHYARIGDVSGQPVILRSTDPKKDQSYFLWSTPRSALGRLHFPVGGQDKGTTRAIAQELGLINARRPDSQEICFVSGELDQYLSAHVPGQLGPIVNRVGQVLGQHRGLAHYTVGQRKGLGIACSQPLYVLEMHPAANTLVVGEQEECLKDCFTVDTLNWHVDLPQAPLEVAVQVRHRAAPLAGLVQVEGNRAQVKLQRPSFGVAPGQSAVFYQDELLLGGGVIL